MTTTEAREIFTQLREIVQKLAVLEETQKLVAAHDRILRGCNGEPGIVAEVKAHEKQLGEISSIERQDRSRWATAGLCLATGLIVAMGSSLFQMLLTGG